MPLCTFSGHTFFDSGLNADSTVIDLGANVGRFSHDIVDRYGCRVFALEANPELFRRIPMSHRLSAYNLAIAGSPGTLPFYLSTNNESSSLLQSPEVDLVNPIDVEAVTLEGFCRLHRIDSVDLLKFDVEGAEIAVFDACSDEFLESVPQITVEFHDFIGLTPVSEVRRVVHRLEEIGFHVLKMWGNAWGDTLFVNRRMCPTSYTQVIWAKHGLRNWRGFKRVVARKLSPATHS